MLFVKKETRIVSLVNGFLSLTVRGCCLKSKLPKVSFAPRFADFKVKKMADKIRLLFK